MSQPTVEVLAPGALTTVQDLGRPGHQQAGVTPGGAMDRFAASAANILAFNDVGGAVLEITLLGPQLRFLTDTLFALTGADLTAKLADRYLPPWSSAAVTAGQVLSFGARTSGARAFLGLSGGFNVPVILGSRSTDLRSRIGGYYGRHLKSGDILNGNRPTVDRSRLVGGRSLLAADLARLRPDTGSPIRILRDARDVRIGDDLFRQFVASQYFVRPESDRMGFRLEGPELKLSAEETANDWSAPVTVGTVQLPPAGQPIVLMADRQTVGGYARLGTVISVDIARLAQAAPGDSVRFAETTLQEAQLLQRDELQYLAILRLANI